MRDYELGATLNRELKQRIRAANGITIHKQVMRNDIKMAAKIIQILDKKYKLWDDPEEEKKDDEKEVGVLLQVFEHNHRFLPRDIMFLATINYCHCFFFHSKNLGLSLKTLC